MKRGLIVFVLLALVLSLVSCRGKHQCREAESSFPETVSEIE